MNSRRWLRVIKMASLEHESPNAHRVEYGDKQLWTTHAADS